MNTQLGNKQVSKRNVKQHGGMLPVIAIGMLAMLGVAGLAVDSSHAFVNVTRVQNALDAAALSAARTLHITSKNTVIATADGNSTFSEHLEGELDSSGASVSFEFSATLNPFVPGSTDPNYVRATTSNHTIGIILASVLPGVGDNFTIGSTAVAGPIPLSGGQVCDLAPLLVCGDPTDTDPTDGTLAGLSYGNGEVECLKFGAGTNSGNGGNGNGNNGGGDSAPGVCGAQAPDDPDGVGPGNYHLLRIGSNGGNVVRQNLAGAAESCAILGGVLDTQPGNLVGPSRQGLNTRFGQYQGGGLNQSDFPPDLVTASPLTYAEYSSIYNAGETAGTPFVSGGEEFRRVMPVPIADCAGIQNGQSQVPIIAIGCYFIRQPIESGGQESYIVGELIGDCNASGVPGDSTPALGGPFKIILYNDPGNNAA